MALRAVVLLRSSACAGQSGADRDIDGGSKGLIQQRANANQAEVLATPQVGEAATTECETGRQHRCQQNRLLQHQKYSIMARNKDTGFLLPAPGQELP